MREGERIRFKQPFKPSPSSDITYQLGIVTAIVVDDSTSATTEVLVRLYDPDIDSFYVDELGREALYSFLLDEIELEL